MSEGEPVRAMPMHFWYSIAGLSPQFTAKTTQMRILFCVAWQMHFSISNDCYSCVHLLKIFWNHCVLAVAQCSQLKMAPNLCVLPTGWVELNRIIR